MFSGAVHQLTFVWCWFVYVYHVLTCDTLLVSLQCYSPLIKDKISGRNSQKRKNYASHSSWK
jgi:hypothetical protein